MVYEAKNYDHLLGMPGFSDQLLKNHFTLYQGYVKNVNTMVQEPGALMEDGKFGTPAHSEIQRRFGWEFNGMRLHELYFGNMTRTPNALATDSKLRAHISRIYGSFESWEKYFRAVGAMRGIGWAVLYHDIASDELFNVWVNEHDVGHLAGAVPLLVLDVFEHAYTLDYGIKKADYIEAFFRAMDWSVVGRRFTEPVPGLR